MTDKIFICLADGPLKTWKIFLGEPFTMINRVYVASLYLVFVVPLGTRLLSIKCGTNDRKITPSATVLHGLGARKLSHFFS